MNNVFYTVGDYKTYQTGDAWQHITSGGPNWRLCLFEEKFSTTAWSTEPSDSLDVLYKKRIDSLRSKYNKIRLWYSAGRDSHCVLEEFVKNGVVIDELLFVDWAYVECFNNDPDVVFDAVKRTYAKNPNLSIPEFKIFRPTHSDYLKYWKMVSSNRHSGGVGSNFGFNLNSFSAVLDSVGELQSDNMCNLFGLEKPKLKIKNNQVLFQMTDLSIQHAMSPFHNIEWFFLNDAVPELVVKQCHMLLRYAKILSKNKFNNDLGRAIHALQTDQHYYNEYCLALGLGTSVSVVTGSGGRKNFGFNSAAYNGLRDTASSDLWDANKFYKKFLLNTTDISNKYVGAANVDQPFIGIISKEYMIHELQNSN